MWFPDSSPGPLALWLVLLVVLAGRTVAIVVGVTVAAHIGWPGTLIVFSTQIVVHKVLSQPLSHVILTVSLAGIYHSLSFYRRGKWRYCLPKFSHPVLCLWVSTQYSVCYMSFFNVLLNTQYSRCGWECYKSWWEKKQKRRRHQGTRAAWQRWWWWWWGSESRGDGPKHDLQVCEPGWCLTCLSPPWTSRLGTRLSSPQWLGEIPWTKERLAWVLVLSACPLQPSLCISKHFSGSPPGKFNLMNS